MTEHHLKERATVGKSARLGFIGAGNMANCIIGGLINNGYPPKNIIVSDPSAGALDGLQRQFDIITSAANKEVCQWAQIVVLAVKPQVMETVAVEIKTGLAHSPLIISIAAGITSRQLQQWLGNDIAVVRAMPNTPALVQTGATGLYATAAVSRQQRAETEAIFNTVGRTVHVDKEPLIDAVTAVSGSGPAYFFLLMEAMIEAGVKQGLDRETAELLTVQTALGAGQLAKVSDTSVGELRRRVTSPGGTTEQAILHFQRAGFERAVSEAIDACAERSRELTQGFN